MIDRDQDVIRGLGYTIALAPVQWLAWVIEAPVGAEWNGYRRWCAIIGLHAYPTPCVRLAPYLRGYWVQRVEREAQRPAPLQIFPRW